MKTPIALLTAALCIVSCLSAPITTPPSPPAPVNEGADKTSSSLEDIDDVMMDPSANIPWQKHEGDITYLTDKFLFPEDPEDPFFELPAEQRSKRAAVKNRYRLWTNGVVPYIISDAYTESEIKVIIKAMDHWESHTCIRFVPRTDQRDYISIYPGSGCYSYVGRIGRNQGISVGRRCFAFYTAVHEIGHALGFYHEQSRPDRDEHVQIITDNIVDGLASEFEKLSEDRVDSLGVGYDYNSIMHYDATLYSRNGSPTIIALDPSIPIGKARELSTLDIEQTNRLYNCPAVPPPRSTIAPADVEEGPTFPPQLPYPGCGGFITELNGTIQSPGFPQYSHNVDCVWLFKMPLPGFNILFDFIPFHVEESPNCESDYIQLYESLDTSGYTSGKKCGNFYSFYPMSTLTSYAYLHFHTNGSNETPNLKGFKLQYSAVDIDECHPLWKVCSHNCHNFKGGYECSCPEGYFLSSDGKNCFDVNECGLDKGGCDHKCVNQGGSYHCTCEDGYTLQKDNKTCVADGAGDPCIEADCEYKCELVNNQAQCQCQSGYQLGSDSKSCVDINECLSHNGNCQHLCVNNDGSFSCACNPGYDLMPDRYSCLPSDPCSVNNGGCDHICTITGSSRVCSCRSGYELASDGTSCVENVDLCASNGGKGDCEHTCANTPGSRVCSCPAGYQLLADGVSCEDIDECKTNNGGCERMDCINQEGSHKCGCNEGFKLRNDANGCAEILQGPSGTISSGNWPETYPNNVDIQWIIQCESHQAVELAFSSGFGIAGSLPTCSKDWLKVFDGDSTSSELMGKFCHYAIPHVSRSSSSSLLIYFYAGPSHNSVRKGFEVSYTCMDVALPATTTVAPEVKPETTTSVINPCAVNNGGCDHTCTVSGDSRVCSCRYGYQLSSDGTSCTDINECASNGGKGDCEHTCTNTPGSRVCSCLTGYRLDADGVSCEDIDECKTNNGGCERMDCINQEGSHECGCKEGFKLRDDANGCAEILQGPSGTISSGNWPETYPNNVDIQWIIQCESHQAVELAFSSGFGIAGSLPTCSKDWLKVFDGDSTSSELMGKFCHYAIPQVSRSSSNSLLIYFYAGPSHNSVRKGFEVSYTCVDVALPATTTVVLPPTTTVAPEVKSETTPSVETTPIMGLQPILPEQPEQCGQTLFTESSGTIESPNWPQTYPTNLQCEYFIQLPDENSVVEISFDNGFRIAGTYPDCPKDWVKVYDGHTNDGTLHGTYCNIETPPSVITTSGSKAKIVLYAGPAHNPSRNGFSATYRSVTR